MRAVISYPCLVVLPATDWDSKMDLIRQGFFHKGDDANGGLVGMG